MDINRHIPNKKRTGSATIAPETKRVFAKRLLFVLAFLIAGISLSAQKNGFGETHKKHTDVFRLLQQSIQILPAEGAMLNAELKRIKSAYKKISDSIKKHAAPGIYAGFETQRLINFCYASQDLKELKTNQKELFGHLAFYRRHFQNVDSVNNEIARCIVNAYETQNIWFKDTLLHHVTSAAGQHMAALEPESIKAQQVLVNMYAAQYYKRGIVSMAEPVFRHFAQLYSDSVVKKDELKLSQDYPALTPNLQPSGKTITGLDGSKIYIVTDEESPFDLVYLISQLRTAAEAYPETPVFLLRDSTIVSDAYLQALNRNLADARYFVVNLQGNDPANAAKYHRFSAQTKDGELLYSGNNPIDFLIWLEKPLAGKTAVKKQNIMRNYEKIERRKDSIAALPHDNTLKYDTTVGRFNINFKGYWNNQPEIEFRSYNFTKSFPYAATDEKQMAELTVYFDQHPVYSLNFLPANSSMEINLTADPQSNIHAAFNDKVNRSWNKNSGNMEGLISQSKAYDHILEHYPFTGSGFYKKIKKRSHRAEKRIMKIIKKAMPYEKAIHALKHDLIKLQTAPVDSMITRDDFNKYFPVEAFDSAIWRSPYYGAWVNAWLDYGSQDMKNAIDVLFASWQVVPDEATEITGKFIWEKMNSSGRFDMMMHLDTTWLQGCSDVIDVDVKKRIEGYKRMAIGKTAPNISWEEDGRKMDLYSIKADTIIVVFWSDGCIHCKEELPAMYERLSDKPGFEVVAVAVDNDDSSLESGRKNFPGWRHVHAKGGWKDEFIDLYNIFGTPEMYVLDGDFTIVEKRIRYSD